MNRKLLVIPVLAIFLLTIVAPLTTEVDADQSDIYIRPLDDITLNSGSSTTVTFVIFNNNDTDDYMFQFKDYGADGISIKCSYEGDPYVESKGSKTITATIDVDKYTRKGDYNCNITISFNDLEQTSQVFDKTLPIKVSVTSVYSGDSFNKILGIFTIPGIDTPELNAAITFGLWLLITFVVILIYNLVVRVFFKDPEDRRIAKEKISWVWFFIIMVYGVYNTLLVYGANERVIDVFWTIMQFVYILFFALVVWNIYKALVHRFFHRIEADQGLDGVDTSLVPLFNMIGKIVIALVGTAVFLYEIGVNVAGIITGAGIIGLAVSLGAQNILTELFGGISLIITRPFIKEDLVRIGSSDDVYEVVDIKLLNTEFKEWGNTAHIIMPNSVVSKSKITNCTAIKDAYRVYLYFDVGYNSDTELVRKILLEVADEHPHVIRNGKYTEPTVRLEAFAENSITFRLAVYVDDFDDSPTFLGEMRESAINKMNAAGVDIPFIRREIYRK